MLDLTNLKTAARGFAASVDDLQTKADAAIATLKGHAENTDLQQQADEIASTIAAASSALQGITTALDAAVAANPLPAPPPEPVADPEPAP